MRLFKKNPKISFLSYYKYAFGLSVIFIVSGIIKGNDAIGFAYKLEESSYSLMFLEEKQFPI